MKLRRNKLLVEPPAGASSDIAFILIVFFLVCASVQPEQGRPQEIPKSEEEPDKKNQSQNPEVELTRLASLLARKERQEDKVVVLKSRKDVPYERWINVTGLIEQAGGVVTLQLEEEQAHIVN